MHCHMIMQVEGAKHMIPIDLVSRILVNSRHMEVISIVLLDQSV